MYELVSNDGTSMKKSFGDYEILYERVKHKLPSGVDKPPKKKLFLAESRLLEKRKLWIEQFSAHLLNSEASK